MKESVSPGPTRESWICTHRGELGLGPQEWAGFEPTAVSWFWIHLGELGLNPQGWTRSKYTGVSWVWPTGVSWMGWVCTQPGDLGWRGWWAAAGISTHLCVWFGPERPGWLTCHSVAVWPAVPEPLVTSISSSVEWKEMAPMAHCTGPLKPLPSCSWSVLELPLPVIGTQPISHSKPLNSQTVVSKLHSSLSLGVGGQIKHKMSS